MLITKEIKRHSKIINIKELPINSHKKVEVKCDNCGKIKNVVYQSYNIMTKNNTEKYYCNNTDCINKKRQISIQEKYGVDNVFQLDNIKDKIKESNLELYGVENPHQNKNIINKAENTNLKKYGVKNPFQSEIIKEKIKKSNLELYGVEYPSQNKDFFFKKLKSGLLIQHINNLTYQGSYEKDFIMKYKDTVKIENGLSIKYKYLDVDKIYHSDFYLPDFDLIVEIKSSYWYNIHLDRCIEKAKFSKKIHNYIMILDKDYSEFEKIVLE
ncbi:hypothetical protein M0Q97_01020 [Candidatus Dojkabacteria bacterium]|jgi:hypothetical protein|nr:hypothetical protein [Candidatus Dojkabacteria bacterium]